MRIKLSDPQRLWWCDIPLPESTQLVLRDLLLGRTVKIEVDPDLQARIGEALTAALLDVFDPKHKLPTARQLRFAEQIATALGITIPAKVRASRRQISWFISAYVARYWHRRYLNDPLVGWGDIDEWPSDSPYRAPEREHRDDSETDLDENED